MKHLFKRNGDRRVIGINFHDFCHIVPPLACDFIGGFCILRVAVAFHFLITEEDIGVFVPEYGVVFNA